VDKLESKHTDSTTTHAERQRQVKRLEAAKIREQAREAARAEAWAQARAGIRGSLILTVLVTLTVGIAIGTYGLSPRRDDASTGLHAMGEEERRRSNEVGLVTITPWPIRVYVSGAVGEPQIVELPPGSLVADAIRGAGGMAENADQDALNLAAFVSDNQHLIVPVRSAATQVAAGDTPIPAPININTATEDELQRLPTIGETRAHDIIIYREAQGPFEDVEDLLAVPGIGPVTLERIAPFITVAP